MIFVIIATLWIACGVLAYGLTLAFFQRKFPLIAADDYWDDVLFAVFIGTLGPIGLFTALVSGGTKHGVKWK